MSYDGRIVYGNADILTRKWDANNAYTFATTGVANPVNNIIGGTSFYIDSIVLSMYPNVFNAGGGFTATFLNCPNPTNQIGAIAIASIDIALPTSAPTGAVGSGIELQLNNVKYHNNTGAPGYLGFNINVALSNGAIKGIILGGQTSLVS